MTENVNYRHCQQRFAQTVAWAVARTHEACQFPVQQSAPVPNSKPDNEELSALMQQLRSRHNESLRPLFGPDSQDPDLEHEIGQCYGSLMSHLEAVHAKWCVFIKTKNKLVDLQKISSQCIDEATAEGVRHVQIFAECISKLVRSEAEIRGKAEILAAVLQRHVEYFKLYLGYGRLEAQLVEQTRKIVRIQFVYFKPDYLASIGTGKLFSVCSTDHFHAGSRDTLKKLVEGVFGSRVKFSADYNTIEVG